MRKWLLGSSSEIGVIRRCGRTVVVSVHLLKSLRFGRDLRVVLIKILVSSLQTLVQARHTVTVQPLLSAMFHTSKELDDPPNCRFWTLTPDGDVYPDTLLVP